MTNENKSTILVIDDSHSIRRLIEIGLGEYYRILSCAGAEAARKKIKKEKIDLILLDVNLPEVTGFEFCTELKNHEETSSIPIIFVTGYEKDEDVVKGIELGASDYITKPFHIDVLKVRIENILRMKKLQQAEIELQSFESFKQITATVSHEINNALAIAYGSFYKIQKRAPTEFKTEYEKYFTHLESAHERIKITVRKLKETDKNS
jgi:DNA-binding response OmpR family regulator